MVLKKICMVGVFGTGKTCLVQRYVHSIFSPRYLSTVGVKIDRKAVEIGGEPVTMMLWDLEGRDESRDVSASYVRGAHGVIYVVDGTRPETLDQAYEIHEMVHAQLGSIPGVVALNKVDLQGEWKLGADAERNAAAKGMHAIRTSAKSGDGVEATFRWIAEAAMQPGSA